MSEKILSIASGNSTVKAGDILWVNVDKALMDDILGPRIEIAQKIDSLKLNIWNTDKVVVVSDHYTPPANVNQANIVKFTRDWSKDKHISNYYEFAGPCHQIMVENGHALPGSVVVGTDSHTCMYGALGSFSTGIGSTEMIGVLATGQIWLKVPESIKINCYGKLNNGVMAKDISLKIIGYLGHYGATYKAIEYCGDTISNLSVDERFAITNMAVEAGAKVGLMEYDKKTYDYLKKFNIKDDYYFINPDKDANYCHVKDFDMSLLAPQIACPHEVDNVCEIDKIKNIKINQAYIGSCTGGRYNDLHQAAILLKGKKIAKNVRLLISPASKETYHRCLKDGILEILSNAGATILASSCGACLGVHSGTLADDEICISSTNRNFIGRMGSKNSSVYLASPLSVCASSITGYITDPRFFL